MKIVFDMDNTLVDELGSTRRPGIDDLLAKLSSEHTLYLWTSSSRDRAISILEDHNLKQYFRKFVYREDYDRDNKGLNKDIREIDGDLLIDDDPKQISYMKKIRKKGLLVTAYRKNMEISDCSELYQKIRQQRPLFERLLSLLRLSP